MISNCFLPSDITTLNKISRASIGLITASVLKNGDVMYTQPGGCTFSNRPIDLHEFVLEQLSEIQIDEEEKYAKRNEILPEKLVINCSTRQGTSIGVFFNAISCAYVYKNEIIIKGYPLENVCLKLIEMLKVATNREIEVDEVKNIVHIKKINKIHINKTINIKVNPDITQAMSYILLFYDKLDQIVLTNIQKSDFAKCYLDYLDKIGLDIIDTPEGIIFNKGINKFSRYEVVQVGQIPHMSTDIGPVIASFLASHDYHGVIVDKTYNNRSSHIKQLNKFKLNLAYEEDGITKILSPKDKTENENELIEVEACDIRAGMSILVAFISSSYRNLVIRNFDQICRGYGNISQVLDKLGVEQHVR